MLNVAHILIYSSATRGGASLVYPRHDRHTPIWIFHAIPASKDVADVDYDAFLHPISMPADHVSSGE
jgi:hypothetical protein